jgi:DNA-binding transcriptional LysR family regulator
VRKIDLASINLNLLVALDALLRDRSVTEAARRTRVTPSAMSHSLASLRDLVGDQLLVRSGRGMVLTPRAEALVAPLRLLLGDAERLLAGGASFDPSSAKRTFVIAAPDFLTTLLLPPLLAATQSVAPGIAFEVVPSVRRANAWLLESGEVDLALGAIVEAAPGIRRMDLCTEGFMCAMRKGHPLAKRELDLDAYVSAPHLVITLGEHAGPTWIDQALAKVGRERHIAVRVRYFMAAPLVIARSSLITTGPSMLLQYFAELVPLRLCKPPIDLPTYPEEVYWHERFEKDAGHEWLRATVKSVFLTLGRREAPKKRAW